jgi:hypothetical protein
MGIKKKAYIKHVVSRFGSFQKCMEEERKRRGGKEEAVRHKDILESSLSFLSTVSSSFSLARTVSQSISLPQSTHKSRF